MITDQEIADLLEDATKQIAGDIHWPPYIGRPPAQIFSAPIESATGWDDPIAVWRQFCAMINVRHSGILQEPER